MTAVSAPRPGWELLAGQVNQRRYEALRAYLYEGASLQQAAGATGYTRAALASLVRDLRAGRLTVFAPPGVPGRKSAPKKDAARGRVIELRREGLSIYEISTRLTGEGTPLGRTAVSDILREEGFGRLLRGPEPEASISPATSGRDTRLPAAAVTDFAALPRRAHTTMAGLLLTIPDLVALDLPAMTQPILGELDDRGVKFATLRMRSPSRTRRISALTSNDFKQITLDRTGRHTKPKVAESTGVKLTSYPGTVRQLIVTGLGREAPA